MDEQAVMRVPPNNADAERSVLSCMMQDREALTLAFELLLFGVGVVLTLFYLLLV